jgi:hypothetical protein
MSDFERLMIDEERVLRWSAEHARVSAHLEIAQAMRNCSRLIHLKDPVEKLGIHREKLRALLAYVWHGDVGRMERDFAKLETTP